MSDVRQQEDYRGASVALDEPLIAIPVDENGTDRVLYFTSEAEASAFVRKLHPQGPTSYAGIWSDLDADEMLDGFDQLRHEVTPTPPSDDF